MKKITIIGLLILMGLGLVAQPAPPPGKQWQLISNMSDEFDGNSLDMTKWEITNATGWVGRSPGLFIDDAIEVGGGDLKITNSKLPSSVIRNGKMFTHGCGLVASKQANTYGYYECRMKASKTFMSSTFWLINNRNEGSGCDKRTTELDIQETVGEASGPSWVYNTIRNMGSNTHSRNTTCSSTPVSAKGDHTSLSNQSWQSYHIYGAWWKSKNEILFYLDNVFVYKIVPPADFDLPMYLRMVTETYDWNPVPSDGGMMGSKNSRTTYYDWVHSYKLVNATTSTPLIANGTYTIEANTSNQRLLTRALENHEARMHDPLHYDDQKWVFNHLGNNIYTIKNKGNGRYLEVPYAVCANGTQTATHTSANSNHQKWKVVANGIGIYALKPAHCQTQALDRNNGILNTNVHTYTFGTGNGNQKWRIKPVVSAVSIAQNNGMEDEHSAITVYPNPAHGMATIKGLPLNAIVKIFNVFGGEVANIRVQSDQYEFDLIDFEPGVYMVSVNDEVVEKLIVK